MTTLIYSMSFLPILLVTLTAHELGHYLMARLYQIKIAGFQIGAGRRLWTIYTGNTEIARPPDLPVLNPEAPPLKEGDLASVYVTQDQGDRFSAQAILPRNTKHKLPREHWEPVREQNLSNMQLTGRIRELSPTTIVLADMSWSIRAIPLMAGVLLPEDPARKIKNVYNTTTWQRQFLITLAGPAANIILMLAIFVFLAAFPITTTSKPLLMVSHVVPGSPADQAGLQVDDRIIRTDKKLGPTQDQMDQSIAGALSTGKPLAMEVTRHSHNLRLEIHPDPTTGLIGMGVTRHLPPGANSSMAPIAIAQRFTSLGQVYINSIGALAHSFRGQEQAAPLVSGPVMGAYETAQAIQFAGPKAWLLVLATVNLGIAFLNLLPIPPLDGYRLVIEAIQALRHGEPINPELERIMVMGGITLIWLAGIYLVLNDLVQLFQ